MYPELHCRSAFSFLEGASLPEDLVEQCKQLEIPAMALVDTDNVSGAPRFYMAAKKVGIRPHIGAEITAETGGRYIVLVENRTGYQNLCRLITSMKLRSKKGKAAASEAEFRQYAKGLVCLADGTQPIEILLDIYGAGNVYAEIQRHLNREEEVHMQRVRESAAKWKLPLIASNGVRYAHPDRRELMDILTCVRQKTTIHEAGRLLEKNAEHFLKPHRSMSRLFADAPEAIAGAIELSKRLQFTLADLGYEFPRYPVGPGETMHSVLRARTLAGAAQRYGLDHEKAYKQIHRELALIELRELSGYFLIVWDLVEFCRRQNILVQGRGSAANSAVCYSLGITAVDPIEMNLLFERFLSEERTEWPDIDLDLPSGDDRERIIQYVYQRYGKLGAAMTANVITYRSRSATRDVGKALGFDEESLERISKLSSRGAWELENPKESRREEQFRAAGLDTSGDMVQKLLELSKQIQSLPRHLGQHSGGMVICQGQLDSIVPLEPATMPGRVIVQWDKDDCADLGLIKVDLLGLGMMAVLKDSLTLIRDHYHEQVDLAQLPPDDPPVYQALQKADTVGWFQVESRAQMSCLPRMKPENFYDIVVQVAIIRPGPIVGKMMHPYLRRREKREDVVCLHPSLESVLHRTLGVPLFQEQLLRMAMIVADFTGGEAEELRRAMGFKRSEQRMINIDKRLREGMAKKGIVGETQETIVKSITSFALYGFPESHAASFALLAYASGYLKCHYLAAFTAAMLNNQPMGFYSPLTLVKDAQRHGLHFLPVDVTRSVWLCTIEEAHWQAGGTGGFACQRAVRLGFNYVKGFNEKTTQRMVAERSKAAFSGIDDLRQRVPELSRSDITALADLGALNEIGDRKRHRRDALWQSELALRPVTELLKDAGTPEVPSPLLPMNPVERLESDFFNSGLSIGPHPMRFHRNALTKMNVVTAGEVKNLADGQNIRIAGAVICRQQPGTAKGFVFLSIEDETGIANVIFTPDVFNRLRATILGHSYLLIDGVLQNQRGVASLKGFAVQPCPMETTAMATSHDFH